MTAAKVTISVGLFNITLNPSLSNNKILCLSRRKSVRERAEE
jgi:hypothetical protein